MRYSDKVNDHFNNPRNMGSMDRQDPQVGTAVVGAPACGDVMQLQLKISEEGVIEDAKFKTFGCGSAIASSSLVTTMVKGKRVEEAETLRNVDIAAELDCLTTEDSLFSSCGRRNQRSHPKLSRKEGEIS